MTAALHRIGLLLALTFVSVGCSVTHDVGENTTPVHRVYARPQHAELSVRPLLDQRAADADNRALLSASDELEVRGETQCVNGERNYRGNQAPGQVTRFLSRRIRERGAFKDVTVSGAGSYVLSGTLATFYGRQEISGAARTGVMFGLIGALATSGAKTDGAVRVALRDLVLEDRITNRRIPLADIEVTRQGELAASASCMTIYQHVDDALSDAATRLAEAVEHALAEPAPRQPTAAPPASDMAFGEVTVTALYAHASTPDAWQDAEAAEVLINGRVAGVTPLHDGLPPGHYTIEVRYQGSPAQRFEIDAVAGQPQRIEARIVLPPTREELAAAQAARAQEHRAWQARMEERAPARRNLLIAAIATGVGGAAALTAGVLLKSSASDTDDEIQDAHALWTRTTDDAARAMLEDEIRAQESDRDRDDLFGNVLAITGGAALVTSVVLLAVRPSDLEEPPPVTLAVGADLHGASAWLRVSGDL